MKKRRPEFNKVFARLTPMVVGALGSNEDLRDIIDETYAKRPKDYYKAYREGVADLYEKEITKYYSFQHTTYIEKIGGIVEYAFDTGNYLDVHRIIKRGYAPLYKMVLHSTHVITAEATRKIEAMYKDTFMSEISLYNGYIVTMYLVAIEEAFKGRHIKADYNHWTYLIDKTESFMEGNLSLFADYQEPLKVKREDLELRGVLDTFRDMTTFEDFLEKIIEEAHRETFFPHEPAGTDIYKKYPEEVLTVTRDKLFKNGSISAYIGTLTTFLKYYGIFENSFTYELTDVDLNNIQQRVNFSKSYNGLDIDDDVLAITFTYLAVLCKEINVARPLAVRSSKEYQEYENTLQSQQELTDLQAEIQQLKMEKAQLQMELNSKNTALNEVNAEARRITKQNQKLETEAAQLRNAKFETDRLRQLVFSKIDEENNDTQTIKVEALEKTEQYLAGLKVVVIGGHDNWVARLKVKFPEWTYLTVENANNRQLKALQFDYLLFNINKNSHGSYYRIQQNVPTEKLLYANHSNIERTILSMYEQIKG